jgi:transglutaminase superfamily protein
MVLLQNFNYCKRKMVFNYLSRILKKAFRNLFFLMFLNGFLLASVFYFKMESSYENGLFLTIKANIDSKLDPHDTQDSIAVKAMEAVNYLMVNRAYIFNNIKSLGLEADLLHPTSVDLMTTRGACGSYATVLARVLQTYHYPIRIAQMKANGHFGAHNLVEVKTNTGWVVLDPTFNLYFIRPDSQLASFADVQNNWSYYSRQTPRDYDSNYKYEDVRYTDWDKVPILFPAVRRVLTFFWGAQKVNTFSFRTYFLKIYEIYFYLSLFLYIPIFLLTIRRFVKTQLFPDQNIPLTFRNIIKYLKPHINTNSLKRMQSF